MKSSGNTKSYGLGALQLTLYYLSGIQIYLQINDIIDKIFNFLDESNGITVNRQVLELLILFTTLHHKFSIKLFNYMQNNPSKGFNTIFLLIKSGDINTQLFSLTLINSLLLSFSSSDSASLSSSGVSSNVSLNQDPRKLILSSLDQLQFSSYLKVLFFLSHFFDSPSICSSFPLLEMIITFPFYSLSLLLPLLHSSLLLLLILFFHCCSLWEI